MNKQPRFTYPPARRDDVVDDYHGTAVTDPYRWLEEAESAETQGWAAAQNELTRAFLDAVPQRRHIQQRLTSLWNYARYFVPQRRGGRIFFHKNDGLQNQAVIYRQDDLAGGLGQGAAVVLDPNTLSEDGTAAITSEAYSRDGTHLAYGVSRSGSDWQEIYVRQVDSGRDYEERLRWCRFAGIAWKHDGSGFFYNRDPEPGTAEAAEPYTHNKLYWHRLDTPQSEDELVYERPDAPELHFHPHISEDGRYLVLHVWHAAIARNRLYYREVEGEGDFVRLIDEPDAAYGFIGNSGATFYLQTDYQAPNGRIVAVDLERPQREQWREVVAESEDVIDHALMANGKLVVVRLRRAQHQISLYELDGTPAGEIALPAPGSITGISGKAKDKDFFFSFESFLYPNTPFHYDFVTGRLVALHEAAVDFDAAAYETTQVFYESKDGARVSMFLTHQKGLDLDGNNPTLLYGYGGFNLSQTPLFGLPQLVWLEMGGVFAVANLRGGGEYGEAWHEAGMLANKQNVFDDFIAAAEWLCDNGYTRPQRLGIMGRSNGGLLVAACMLQRPELFGAVACVVPVTDMLRYHKFTAGRYWVAEYGDAENSPEHFDFLYAYSPLHNVRAGVAYPPILLTTADTDDRVVPMHALKFGATLQAAAGGGSDTPILIRIETRAGHGLGKPTGKLIDEQSDVYAFLWAMIGRET